MKQCTGCGETKPLDQFSRRPSRARRAAGLAELFRPHCKACQVARVRAWQAANPDKRKLYKARWKAKKGGPEMYALYHRKSNLKRLYGMTPADHEAMLEAQGGRCAVCGQDKDLVVDHNHKTGKVRGLLCRTCNFVIGMYEKYGSTWDAYLARGL